MRDIISEIWSTARRNKLRTTLTGFAVAWGIFMLVVLLGAGNGLIHALENNNNRFIVNSMAIFGGTTSKPHKGMKEGRYVPLRDRGHEYRNKPLSAWVRTISARGFVASIPTISR